LIHCHTFKDLKEDKKLSVLSLCSLLGNEYLTLFLLSSFHSTPLSEQHVGLEMAMLRVPECLKGQIAGATLVDLEQGIVAWF
jgi:hypothetical protein